MKVVLHKDTHILKSSFLSQDIHTFYMIRGPFFQVLRSVSPFVSIIWELEELEQLFLRLKFKAEKCEEKLHLLIERNIFLIWFSSD